MKYAKLENGTLKTNSIKNDIDHQYVSPLCRLYKEKFESVTHIVSMCSVLAGNQYRKRYNRLGKKVHWLLCKKFEIECEDKWFSHQPEAVLENDKCKILWVFVIQTDKKIQRRRPEIVATDKEKRECKIIDIAAPGDQNIKLKELEKNTKNQDLRLQVQKLWDAKATVIPVVVGGLGTVSEELENHLKTIGIPIVISCLRKAALLRTLLSLEGSLPFQRVGNSQMLRRFSHHVVVMLYQNNNNNDSNDKNIVLFKQLTKT